MVFFPNGSTLVNPELRALAEKVGLRAPAQHPFYDLVIIGAVPHSDCVAGLVERSDAGFIVTGPDLLVGGRRGRQLRPQVPGDRVRKRR